MPPGGETVGCHMIRVLDSAGSTLVEWGRQQQQQQQWDHSMEGNAVEDPVVCISGEEELQVLIEIKTGKAHGPSEVSLEWISASGEVRIQVMVKICQRVFDGYE